MLKEPNQISNVTDNATKILTAYKESTTNGLCDFCNTNNSKIMTDLETGKSICISCSVSKMGEKK